MSASKTITACTLLMLSWLAATPAVADLYHYENMLVGERAAGLGGAYAGISDDPSGLYYNPAGVVYTSNSSVSASANAYRRTIIEYEKVLGNQGSWVRSSSSLLPNFFGVTQTLGAVQLGFSFAVTDSTLEDQDQHFYSLLLDDGMGGTISIDDYYINFNNQDNTYRFGPSIAFRMGSNFSAGLTLYGYYRKQELIQNEQVYFTGGDVQWVNQYYEITENGIEPILGLMWTPAQRLAIGLSMRKVMLYYSGARRQHTEFHTFEGNARDPVLSTSVVKRPLPTNIRLGMAWFASQNFLLATDISHYTAAGDRIAVTNFSLGTEFYFTPSWAMRMGLYSDYANTPELVQGVAGQYEHTDLLGLALSLSRFTRSSSLTFGLNHASGSGESDISGTGSLQNMSISATTLYISATYSY